MKSYICKQFIKKKLIFNKKKVKSAENLSVANVQKKKSTTKMILTEQLNQLNQLNQLIH